MRTVAEIRHANLLRLIARHGSIQKLATAVGRSHSQISQLKNRNQHSLAERPRNMGDDLARLFERNLGLEAGWMDAEHTDEDASEAGARPALSDARTGASVSTDATLVAMQMLLADVPEEDRSVVAETLAGWAKAGGGGPWKDRLAGILTSSRKRPAAA